MRRMPSKLGIHQLHATRRSPTTVSIGHTLQQCTRLYMHDVTTQETINSEATRRLPADEPCTPVTLTTCCSAFHDDHSTVIRDDATVPTEHDKQRAQ
jgi:hypothetical protein